MSMRFASEEDLHRSRKGHYEKATCYRQSFIDQCTGLHRNDLLEDRVCPCCDSNQERFLFIKNGGQYKRCQHCGMIYLNPVFTDAALGDYYRNNMTLQAQAHEDEATFYERVYRGGLTLVPESIQPKKILDIGCSSGLFLDIARELGYKTFGIELNLSESKIAAGKGHTIWTKSLEELDVHDKFDLITLWDVFEHIKDGKACLSSLQNYLNPKGHIFMQIPNSGAISARIMQDKCNMFDGIEHVNLYDKATITSVIERSGFRAISMRSIIDEIGPMTNYLEYQDPYSGNFASSIVNDLFTSEELLNKMLGYKLQVVMELI